jgi:5-methylcytosine-specific restriction endonuclease McrA
VRKYIGNVSKRDVPPWADTKARFEGTFPVVVECRGCGLPLKCDAEWGADDCLQACSSGIPHPDCPQKERDKPACSDKFHDVFLAFLPHTSCRESAVSFYASAEWFQLRYEALRRCGARCQCCGATRIEAGRLHVDHIKPRSKFPELALDINNLQVLCEKCNLGKSNRHTDDWRETGS